MLSLCMIHTGARAAFIMHWTSNHAAQSSSRLDVLYLLLYRTDAHLALVEMSQEDGVSDESLTDLAGYLSGHGA